MEQEPINAGVSKSLQVRIEEIDAVKNPQYISMYQLTATPTLLVLVDGNVVERFEGVVHAEQLEAALKKYL